MDVYLYVHFVIFLMQMQVISFIEIAQMKQEKVSVPVHLASPHFITRILACRAQVLL